MWPDKELDAIAVMVNRWFTKRRWNGARALIPLLSAFFSAYSTNIKRFA
jgi:hypothetical protein